MPRRKVVFLQAEDDDRLRKVFELIANMHDRDGYASYVQLREIEKTCYENASVRGFFGLGEEPEPSAIKHFFHSVALDFSFSKSLDWEDFKRWYHSVLRARRALELDACLPPGPDWKAPGGQLAPSLPLTRISNDDLLEGVLRGDVGFVRRLVQSGASVNAPVQPHGHSEFMTLLHVLSCKPNLLNGAGLIEEIIRRQADLDALSTLGSTPLIYACAARNLTAAELLLDAGADPDIADDYSQTALKSALQGHKHMEFSEWETSTASYVRLLVNWGSDLNNGGGAGGHAPLVDAVLANSEVLVDQLLWLGAKPQGLHEAVELAGSNILRSLCEALANPYLRDQEERTVMEIALMRDDYEILDFLREFQGKLERERHPHVKTRQRSAEGNQQEQHKHHSIIRQQHSTVGKNTTWSKRCSRKTAKLCKRISETKTYSMLMLLVLAVALFLPDTFVLSEATAIHVLDWLLVLIFFLFLQEWALQVVANYDTYVGSFFFWMDLVGITSVPLDHSIFTRLTEGGTDGVDSSVLVRLTRLARLGARAGRFTKLVKLMRYLPGMKEAQHETKNTAQVVAAKILSVLSMNVSCLIIMMVIMLPIFDLIRFPEADHSMRAWSAYIAGVVESHPEGLAEAIQDMEIFYKSTSLNYFPYQVNLVFGNGTSTSWRLDADKPFRAADRRPYETDNCTVMFNWKMPNWIDSLMNVLIIITITVMMTGATMVVSNSVSRIVLDPLEELMDCIQDIAGDIFSSVTEMSSKLNRSATSNKGGDNADKAAGEATELDLLDKVLKKLSTLLELATKTKNGAEFTLEGMGDEDQEMLLAWTGAREALPEMLADEHYSPAPGSPGAMDAEIVALEELQWVDASDSWLEDWNWSVFEVTEPQRLSVFVAACVLNGALEETDTDTLQCFAKECSKGYNEPKVAPYHNWMHAVDVTFTAFRILKLCNTSRFLTLHDRLALLLSALCHDIGHTGRQNHFLIEEESDFALRYNDNSPLEQMHAAKLFEILRLPSCAVFEHLEPSQYRVVRHVCIQAILNTDKSRSGQVQQELKSAYNTHAVRFNTAMLEELSSPGSFGDSTDTVDLLRSEEVKSQLRVLVLHFADMSNALKAWSLCKLWADMAVEELLQQGDAERALGMPVLPTHDRAKVNLPYSQLLHAEYIVSPLLFNAGNLLPPLVLYDQALLDNLGEWLHEWDSSPDACEDEHGKMQERLAKLAKTHSRRSLTFRHKLEAICQRVSTRQADEGSAQLDMANVMDDWNFERAVLKLGTAARKSMSATLFKKASFFFPWRGHRPVQGAPQEAETGHKVEAESMDAPSILDDFDDKGAEREVTPAKE
eukprot:TRINITY_DN32207_c0_g1_i1.p1 TRINITY_DN32207_c0_g1~~TRINITY_DN32207_c0_g1_i1.p1  ORF type:complete len:1331 (-),score=275.26 TRINITY_DN32207_c0_g1_i1:89-4081(-)